MRDDGRPYERRCQGRTADGDDCPCREEIRYDRVTRRLLCRWCWSRVDTSDGARMADHAEKTT